MNKTKTENLYKELVDYYDTEINNSKDPVYIDEMSEWVSDLKDYEKFVGKNQNKEVAGDWHDLLFYQTEFLFTLQTFMLYPGEITDEVAKYFDDKMMFLMREKMEALIKMRCHYYM